MAQLVIATAGAAIGSLIPGVGTAVGWAIGSVIGAQFAPKQQIRGPRLDDLKVTGAEYGQPIPWIAGHPRIAGQVWWSSDRREIATTTSTGKGGGGAEQTAYTYECDMLFGLCDREIDGIRRIWLNGKLAWTKHADADADSLAASQQDAPWSRLTVYTGASDQLPDPTYEAAVTNAPAYRGRGSVFIQGLQLGNSGVVPNLTFEVVVDGTSTGALTLLQSYFDGDESTDISAYARGDATLVGEVSLSSEKLQVDVEYSMEPLNEPAYATYDAATFPQTGNEYEPVTFEFFATWAQTPNVSFTRIARLQHSTFGYFDFGYYGNAGNLVFHLEGSGIVWGPSANPAGQTARTHFAMVFGASTFRAYVNGQKVWQSLGSSGGLKIDAGNTWKILLGDNLGYTSGHSTFAFDSFRVRMAEVYTGGSFTPPDELDPPDGGAIVPTPGALQTVVEELCERAGLPAGTYDASALAAVTKPVYAIAVAQVTPARAVLEQLTAGYYFEAYCTDKLYFVPRAGSSAATLTADDMGCGIDAPEPEVLPMQVGSDEEVPSQVAVNYANLDADYNTATEFSDRLLSGQVNTAPAQLPLAFTSAEAKGIADAMLVDSYASRVSGRLALPVAYARLVPTDVVTAPAADGTLYRVRLVRRTDSTPLLEYEWVLDDASAVVSAGITSTDYTPTVNVALPGSTVMALLDCPLLRDSEDQLGHYVAATSRGTTWPGASINRSIDDVEYAEAARVSERAVIGTATSVLADWTGGVVFDEKNTVTVDVQTTLSSSTRDAMLADLTVNAMMIGDELVRYRTATLVSTGIYTLSGLLRGQRGTEWATGTHAAGETVVRLSTDGLRYVPIDTGSLAVERWYKGVTIGRTLASVSSTSFTCNGVSSKPLAPVDVRAGGSADAGLELTWKRRTRLGSTFTGPAGAVVPLGEAAELYEVDLLDGGDAVVSTQQVATASCTFYGALQSRHLPVGVEFVNLAGSDYVGITNEGASFAWKYLVRQTAAGAEIARLYVGDAVYDMLVTGGFAFVRANQINNAATPAVTVKSAVYRIDLDAIASGYTHEYETGSLADYGQIAHDGTYIWVSEPDSANLVKLNKATLAVVTTYSMPGVAPEGLCYDSTTGDLFFGDSTGYVYELVRWNIAGTSETWRVSSTQRISWVRVHGSLVFACCADGKIRVFSVSTGAAVATHDGAAYGPQQFPLLSGEAVAFLYVPGIGAAVNTFNTSTGALAKRFTLAVAESFGGVTGSDIWVTYFPTGTYTDTDSAAYSVAASFSGYSARVYQISATVGRGYAAAIEL